MSVVIKVENLSKYYRLGVIGGGTLREDLNRWWAMRRGKPDPFLKIGAVDHGNRKDGQIWALQDVSFEVQESEILGIIGRNGAGKSTLLKILSRITAPTAGKAKIKGRVASLLEVGTGFHPQLTGRENIYLNGTILGMSRREVSSKLEEIVDFSETSKFIDTPVKRYSSGMIVRLAFAVAAHLEPEILIVDEVLAVGDQAFQKKCLGKMRNVAGEGRTILLVSHNMSSIRSLCSRCVLLDGGRVVMNTDVDEVVEKYLNKLDSNNKALLRDRVDREGSGEARINDIRLLVGKNEEKSSTIIAGMDVVFEIYFELFNSIETPTKLEFGLVFYTHADQFITVLNNEMSNHVITVNERKGVVRCLIRKFPLMSGNYSIRCMLKINRAVVDLVQNATSFHVIEGDYYNSGKPNAHKRQGVYIGQTWES